LSSCYDKHPGLLSYICDDCKKLSKSGLGTLKVLEISHIYMESPSKVWSFL